MRKNNSAVAVPKVLSFDNCPPQSSWEQCTCRDVSAFWKTNHHHIGKMTPQHQLKNSSFPAYHKWTLLRIVKKMIRCLNCPSWTALSPERTAVLCASWEKTRLSHDWFSINAIQFPIFNTVRQPLHVVFPRHIDHATHIYCVNKNTTSEKNFSSHVDISTTLSFN